MPLVPAQLLKGCEELRMSPMRRKDSKMDWVLPWDTSNLAGCWVFPFQAAPSLLLPEATSEPVP